VFIKKTRKGRSGNARGRRGQDSRVARDCNQLITRRHAAPNGIAIVVISAQIYRSDLKQNWKANNETPSSHKAKILFRIIFEKISDKL